MRKIILTGSLLSIASVCFADNFLAFCPPVVSCMVALGERCSFPGYTNTEWFSPNNPWQYQNIYYFRQAIQILPDPQGRYYNVECDYTDQLNKFEVEVKSGGATLKPAWTSYPNSWEPGSTYVPNLCGPNVTPEQCPVSMGYGQSKKN